MYKIIIVDDESTIRQGIAQSIPWAELGFEVVGLYANGRAALDNIERDKPDVVLSDIRMPKMDGIALMQALREQYPHIQIVILSGYSDFEYLNMSIKSNVFEYLLKPTNPREFKKLFTEMRHRLDEDRSHQKRYIDGQRVLHDAWLSALVKGYAEADTLARVRELEAAYRYHFDNCHVVLLTPDGRLGDEESDVYALKRRIIDWANEVDTSLSGRFFLNSNEVITGMFGLPTAHNIEESALAADIRAIQLRVHEALGTTVSAGVSDLCSELAMLPQCYEQAKCCVRQNVYLGDGSVFFYHEFEAGAAEGSAYFDITLLTAGLLADDFDAIEGEVRRVFETLADHPHKDWELVDRLCIETMFRLSRWALQYNIRYEHLLEELGTKYSDIYRLDSLDKKKHFLLATMYSLQQQLKQAGGNTRSSLAFAVRQFVDKEYANNSLSLELVAQTMDKSAAHISRIFKNEVGCTFVEYLTRKRMEKAAALLGDVSQKVYEVAAAVGYADTSHFIRVFKKYYGKSPNEYRAVACRGGVA